MIEHTPALDLKFGAPMGRGFRSEAAATRYPIGASKASVEAVMKAFKGRVYLRKIPLNDGGYDQGGAYWGRGQTLYSALSACGTVDRTMRACDREAAKCKILADFPNASFFR